MVLNKQDRKYKCYIALNKERRKVWDAQRNLPWTEVSKPYQDGWFIYLDFHDEVKRRDDYPFLKMVLDLSAYEGRTRDPKMVGKIIKCKRIGDVYRLFAGPKGNPFSEYQDYYRDRGNVFPYLASSSYGIGTPACRGRIRKEDAEKLPPGCNKWIYKVVDDERLWYKAKGVEYYRDAIPNHFLKMKIRKAMVTHVRDVDPVLQKREAEIKKELAPLGRMFWGGNSMDYDYHYRNRARRAHDRAVMRKLEKGEIEDFEHLRKNINYD